MQNAVQYRRHQMEETPGSTRVNARETTSTFELIAVACPDGAMDLVYQQRLRRQSDCVDALDLLFYGFGPHI